MSIMQLIRAASFGICFYAGIYHLLVGLRRTPVDRIHISFALTALAFAFRNFAEVLFNTAASNHQMDIYLYWGHLAVTGYILGLIFLTWFVTIFTKAKPVVIPIAITAAWLAILCIHQNSPYFYLFTEKPEFVDVTLPWGEVVTYGNAPMSFWADMEWILILSMVIFYLYATARQYLRGERREAWAIGLAVTVYMGAYINDLLLDYDLISSIYILAQGFVVIIIMMSLTLSNEIIETERELANLNEQLEDRISDRTAKLMQAKEAAEVANQSKSVFLANMSHELRTPLNVILGHAQIMARNKSIKPDQRKSVTAIATSGDSLLMLINSVLEMSKIEAGQLVLSPSVFDVDSLLSDMQIMFGVRIRQKGLGFFVGKGSDKVVVVEADREKINQILINLLSNAVRYTSSGTISLQVDFERNSPGAAQLTFEVIDQGPGIREEDLERIFEPFVQADVEKATQTGTGLGLAISKKYAQIMNGELTVASRRGQGSTFRLTIPVIESKDSRAKGKKTNVPIIVGINGESPTYRILVVDDETSNREILRRMLQAVGFESLETSGGQEAIDICAASPPDLVLMDIRMPGVDGIQAIETIKTSGSGHSIPIIGVSASVFEKDKAVVIDSGADDFIAKPVQEAELFEKIGRLLNINYMYDDETPTETIQSQLPTLTVNRLSTLPETLFVEMQAAVRGGYMDRMQKLCKRAADHDPDLSRQLLELVDRFENEALTVLFVSNYPEKEGGSP